jgi:hypothetical protein
LKKKKKKDKVVEDQQLYKTKKKDSGKLETVKEEDGLSKEQSMKKKILDKIINGARDTPNYTSITRVIKIVK